MSKIINKPCQRLSKWQKYIRFKWQHCFQHLFFYFKFCHNRRSPNISTIPLLSSLSNNHGVWNKRGVVQKSQNQLAFFWQFLRSKWLWEKLSSGSVRISESFAMKSLNMEGGFFLGRVEFFKIGQHDFKFIRRWE